MTSFLYVEDDPLSREIIEIALKTIMNFEDVWIFEDSHDFEQRISNLASVPDVIMLDIHMTPINGFEMLALLRQNGKYSNSRIIALTASVMNEEVSMLKNSGFDGGIGKPIDPEVFPDLIRRVIAGETVWYISS